MKFVVESVTKCSGRLGCLSKSDAFNLKTPTFMHYTKSASVPYLAREVFSYITTDQHCYEITVDSTYHMRNAVKVSGSGVAAYSGLGGHDKVMTFLTVKNPGEVTRTGHHEQEVLPIFTRTGKTLISADEYMDVVESFLPDMFHTLCDGDTNPESSNKREQKSYERTEEFFEKCKKRFQASDRLKSSLFLAAIEGGYNVKTREKMCQNLKHDDVGGYFLDGFHSNGSTVSTLNMDDVKAIVSRCVSLLPEDKLKLMLGPYAPAAMLELVRLGIDVFDNSYAYMASINNCALTFSHAVGKTPNEHTSYDIDLSNEKYKLDFKPFDSDCTCMACQNHTRAYVHHLINTKELLAPILLMIHNTHHYLEFFKSVRQSVNSDTLPELIMLIEQQAREGSCIDAKLQEPPEVRSVSPKDSLKKKTSK